jgi:photosystem II Psb27 protein
MYPSSNSLQAALLAEINRVIPLEGGSKEAAVNDLKKQMNTWTSKYRRNDKVGGRPSFGYMYTAVNALAGHWNSFGADSAIPKKRLARIEKARPLLAWVSAFMHA